MSDLTPVTPLFINTMMNLNSTAAAAQSFANINQASTAWATANLAIYVPMWLPYPYPVRRVYWLNGSSAGGNIDFGIYTADGTRLYSTGSTAGSGNSAPQFVAPTEFLLAPGAYYFALAIDNTTANRMSAGIVLTANMLRLCGVLQQASAFALPATATFATATDAIYPICGITKTASGF